MNSFFVLTGAPGSGKTTLLDGLRGLGLAAVDEPARQILAEQRSIGGADLPEQDPNLFTQLLLSRAVYEHRRHGARRQLLLFDRGLPDVIGYARLFGVAAGPATAAARRYRYNRCVFLTPALPEIYRQDEERRMTFEEARTFGEMIRSAYAELGYDIVELPRGSPGERAGFILSEMLQRLGH